MKTPDRIETILRALKAGCTKETAAHFAGITRQTLRQWEREDETFSYAVKEARANILYKAWDRQCKLVDSLNEETARRASEFVIERREQQLGSIVLEDDEAQEALAARARIAWDEMRATIPTAQSN